MRNKKKKLSSQQQRALRTQQIIMGILGALVILTMIIQLIGRY